MLAKLEVMEAKLHQKGIGKKTIENKTNNKALAKDIRADDIQSCALNMQRNVTRKQVTQKELSIRI